VQPRLDLRTRPAHITVDAAAQGCEAGGRRSGKGWLTARQVELVHVGGVEGREGAPQVGQAVGQLGVVLRGVPLAHPHQPPPPHKAAELALRPQVEELQSAGQTGQIAMRSGMRAAGQSVR
jgi:hypothetical protein